MRERASQSLKLHVEQATLKTSQSRGLRNIDSFCLAFQKATGWELRYALQGPAPEMAVWTTPVDKPSGGCPATLSLLAPGADDTAALDRETVQPLAFAFASVLSELDAAHQALRQREAELAAGVPITSRPNEKEHLAERLEAVLAGGAQALGCTAAALYLLDDATTELKLRSASGLPADRLVAPARPLKGAVADLEALVGHAVVLEDTSLLPHWKVPEPCESAVCVPVSTSTVPLGTLWFFNVQKRDYSPRETNLAEIVAGRIASDLEREMLLQEGVQSKQVKKQWASAAAWQQQRLPQISPLLDDWQLAGWTEQAAGVGGDFYDWSIHPDGRLTLALGNARGGMLTSGLTAAALQAALRAHGNYSHTAPVMLDRLNETLWTSSAGDQLASFFYGLVDPETGGMEFSAAGPAAALLVRQGKTEMLSPQHALLGADPDELYAAWHRTLIPGDVVILLGEGVREARDHSGLRIGESAVAQLVRRMLRQSAQDLADRIRDLLRHECPSRDQLDRSVVVLKRRS